MDSITGGNLINGESDCLGWVMGGAGERGVVIGAEISGLAPVSPDETDFLIFLGGCRDILNSDAFHESIDICSILCLLLFI